MLNASRQPIRIVYLEDDPGACALVRAMFVEDGLNCTLDCVEDEPAFVIALQPPPDLILADFNLPTMAGLRALELKENLCPTTPFIFVSGSIGEAVAINALKHGVTDFVLKDSLARLPSTVRRALAEARQLREKIAAEEDRQAHLLFLGNLDRINRAIQSANDVEQMMSNVLDALLTIFECDRAWLVYPSDPDSPSWRIAMERTRPEYPTMIPAGVEIPMQPNVATAIRIVKEARGPVRFDAESAHRVPAELVQQYNVQSQIVMMLTPKTGQPWLFGLHQCSSPRVWRQNEEILFQEAGRRLTDGLTGLLAFQNLREANSRVAEILESITDAFVALDRDWRYTYVNERAAQILGMPRTELLGKCMCDVLPEILNTGAQAQFQRAVAEQSPARFVFFLPSRDRWFESHAFPTKDGLSVYSTDITDRKRAEEALRKREQESQVLLENAPDAISRFDRECRLIYVNPASQGLLGKSAGELLGKTPLELYPGKESAGTFQGKIREVLATGISVEFESAGLTGDDHVFLIRIVPEREQGGQMASALSISRDVTERRKLEEQLRQSQKMEAIGQLAGGIAHDFNNLLAVVQMQSSLLLTHPGSEAEMRDGIQQIMAASERAANLTRQLLTFSRRSVREAKEIDLGEVIGHMTKLIRRLLGEDIALETRFAPVLPLINADAGMMEQVLMNLAVNARDAMPNGGRLIVSLKFVSLGTNCTATQPRSRPGRFVCLGISDTGCGIPQENLSRIFEPFFTTKEVGKGTGLGLATVFGIVEQHHGWIEVTSEAGQGSTFQIFLPAIEAPLNRPAAAVNKLTVRGGTETILLVEDEPMVRRLARVILERHGYHLLEADSAAAALQRWHERRRPIDLLLTDLIMPGGMSGRELGDQLTGLQPGLKVIYTSGYSDDIVNRQLNLDAGRNFLAKPYSAFALATTIRRRLDEP
ncbi:MAG: PAS domain-containing protein [Akkermansiaceae bacterium]|nr:PAS domain-containing protein [Verrucomicrobiales bacterium]